MRVVSHIFLRKGALGYIFNSKVANVQTHIKYRNKFLEALRNPASFDHIKDYWVIGCVIGWWSGRVVGVGCKGFWGWMWEGKWVWVMLECYATCEIDDWYNTAQVMLSSSVWAQHTLLMMLFLHLPWGLLSSFSSSIFTLIRHKYLITNNRLHQYPSLPLKLIPGIFLKSYEREWV